MPELVYMILGLVLGAVLAFLWLKSRTAHEVAVLQEKAASAEQSAAERERALSAYHELKVEHEKLLIGSEKDLSASQEKLKLLEQAKENLSREFEQLAHRIFTVNAEAGKTSLKEILEPLKSQLGEFRQRVETVYDVEGKQRATLLAQIEELKKLNNDIGREAKDLTTALKGESKIRGNWGEMIVERILELSGLQEGREYETQVYLKEKHGGNRGRYPDFIVHLPHQRDVIIDSKMVLNAYEAYCRTEDEVERAAFLKKHVEAVRLHMSQLSDKQYENLAGLQPLEQVMMCIPNESAYMAAVAEAPQLQEEALKKQILLVGPTTLVLALKIVKSMWRHDDQSRNALQIAERGQKLYEKFVGFVVDMDGMGSALSRAVTSYEEAKKKLSTGNDNLVRQADKLIALGVKSKKRLPPSYIHPEDHES